MKHTCLPMGHSGNGVHNYLIEETTLSSLVSASFLLDGISTYVLYRDMTLAMETIDHGAIRQKTKFSVS